VSVLNRRAGILVAAVLLDLAGGDPPNRYHPVAWFGRLVRVWEARVPGSAKARQVYGGLGAVVLPGVYAGAALIVLRLPGGPRQASEIVLLKSTFALRGLLTAAEAVGSALDADDLPAARESLRALVSREVGGLDRRLVASAAVESLAENVVDSFLAPWLFYAAAGLPGAMAYRALNTLDSMWGYRDQEYEQLGKTAARLDDITNYVPATLAARLILQAGRLLGFEAAQGGRVLTRDGGKTASPNAGRPMSAMAGVLGLRLEKPGAYVLGDAVHDLDTQRIREAQQVVAVTAALGLGIAVCIASILGRRK